jgi:nitroreductase
VEFRDVIRARRSVRDFLPAPVANEVLQRIIDAARLAPSSENSQPWRFYVLTGRRRLYIGGAVAHATEHLKEYVDALGPEDHEKAARWYSSLGGAPVLIAVASPVAADEFAMRARDLSVGTALENLLLAAADEGLGGCSVTYAGWVADDIATELSLAEGWEVLTVVALGHPSGVDLPQQTRRPDDTVWLD